MTYEALVLMIPPLLVAGLGVLAWMLFWESWDEHRTDPWGIMVMAATWGAIFTYVLKSFVDQVDVSSASLYFFVMIIALEELVKSFAEVNALETTGSKFHSKNDGIFYGVAAALGFVFVETFYYLMNAPDFWAVVWGRLVYTAPAHMAFTGIFGMYYGRAYLSEALIGEGNKRNQAPIAVFGNIARSAIERVPEEKRGTWRNLWAVMVGFMRVLTLHITRRHLIFKKPTTGHAASELMTEGFLIAFYLHVAYDRMLVADNEAFRIGGLAGAILIFVFILWRFVQVEWQIDKTRKEKDQPVIQPDQQPNPVNLAN